MLLLALAACQSVEPAPAHSTGPNDYLHLYALWNSGGLEGADPDAEIWARQYLDGVQEWNDRLDALCTTERALWEP